MGKYGDLGKKSLLGAGSGLVCIPTSQWGVGGEPCWVSPDEGSQMSLPVVVYLLDLFHSEFGSECDSGAVRLPWSLWVYTNGSNGHNHPSQAYSDWFLVQTSLLWWKTVDFQSQLVAPSPWGRG